MKDNAKQEFMSIIEKAYGSETVRPSSLIPASDPPVDESLDERAELHGIVYFNTDRELDATMMSLDDNIPFERAGDLGLALYSPATEADAKAALDAEKRASGIGGEFGRGRQRGRYEVNEQREGLFQAGFREMAYAASVLAQDGKADQIKWAFENYGYDPSRDVIIAGDQRWRVRWEGSESRRILEKAGVWHRVQAMINDYLGIKNEQVWLNPNSDILTEAVKIDHLITEGKSVQVHVAHKAQLRFLNEKYLDNDPDTIEIVTRYGAPGNEPDPETMCAGHCEGMGCVPINGKDFEPPLYVRKEGECREGKDKGEPWKTLWIEAEKKEPTEDGWHFVQCPDCKGSGLKEAKAKWNGNIYHYVFEEKLLKQILKDGKLLPVNQSRNKKRLEHYASLEKGLNADEYFEKVYNEKYKPVTGSEYKNFGNFMTPVDLVGIDENLKSRFVIPFSRLKGDTVIQAGSKVVKVESLKDIHKLADDFADPEKVKAIYEKQKFPFVKLPQIINFEDAIAITEKDLEKNLGESLIDSLGEDALTKVLAKAEKEAREQAKRLSDMVKEQPGLVGPDLEAYIKGQERVIEKARKMGDLNNSYFVAAVALLKELKKLGHYDGKVHESIEEQGEVWNSLTTMDREELKALMRAADSLAEEKQEVYVVGKTFLDAMDVMSLETYKRSHGLQGEFIYYRTDTGLTEGNPGDPKPKFKIGDKVKDKDGSRSGVVGFVGEYDKDLGGYRYKVKEADGKRHNWNETLMVKESIEERWSIKNVAGASGSPSHPATSQYVVTDGRQALKIDNGRRVYALNFGALSKVRADKVVEWLNSVGFDGDTITKQQYEAIFEFGDEGSDFKEQVVDKADRIWVIHDKEGRYLTMDGDWSTNESDAAVFPSEEDAQSWVERERPGASYASTVDLHEARKGNFYAKGMDIMRRHIDMGPKTRWVIQNKDGQFLDGEGEWTSQMDEAYRFDHERDVKGHMSWLYRKHGISGAEAIKIEESDDRTEREALKLYLDPTSIQRSHPVAFAKHLIQAGWRDRDILKSIADNFGPVAYGPGAESWPLVAKLAQNSLDWAHDELGEAIDEQGRLVDAIRPGDRVTIVNRFGQKQTGRAVMRGPAGWVLNMGGRHGTPGIATDDNVVKVKPAKKTKDSLAMRRLMGRESVDEEAIEEKRFAPYPEEILAVVRSLHHAAKQGGARVLGPRYSTDAIISDAFFAADKIEKNNVDRWLVKNEHPLAHQAATQEYRFKTLAKEAAEESGLRIESVVDEQTIEEAWDKAKIDKAIKAGSGINSPIGTIRLKKGKGGKVRLVIKRGFDASGKPITDPKKVKKDVEVTGTADEIAKELNKFLGLKESVIKVGDEVTVNPYGRGPTFDPFKSTIKEKYLHENGVTIIYVVETDQGAEMHVHKENLKPVNEQYPDGGEFIVDVSKHIERQGKPFGVKRVSVRGKDEIMIEVEGWQPFHIYFRLENGIAYLRGWGNVPATWAAKNVYKNFPYDNPAAMANVIVGMIDTAQMESVNEGDVFAIGGRGLRKLETGGIHLQPNHEYYMGASSSPSHIIVTKVTDNDVTYFAYPYRKAQKLQRPIADDLIRQGTETWLKSGYVQHFPQLAKVFQNLLAGKKSRLKADVKDFQYVVVMAKPVSGKPIDNENWYAAEEYGNVAGFPEELEITMPRHKLDDLKKDRRFTITSTKEAPARMEAVKSLDLLPHGSVRPTWFKDIGELNAKALMALTGLPTEEENTAVLNDFKTWADKQLQANKEYGSWMDAWKAWGKYPQKPKEDTWLVDQAGAVVITLDLDTDVREAKKEIDQALGAGMPVIIEVLHKVMSRVAATYETNKHVTVRSRDQGVGTGVFSPPSIPSPLPPLNERLKTVKVLRDDPLTLQWEEGTKLLNAAKFSLYVQELKNEGYAPQLTAEELRTGVRGYFRHVDTFFEESDAEKLIAGFKRKALIGGIKSVLDDPDWELISGAKAPYFLALDLS
jgi:hypothetical protein